MTGITFRAPRQPLVPPGGADLHARDMTATFAAEMTLAEAQRRLGDLGQWLPIDGAPDAPLGRLVEENSTGPLRLGYGAWRDLLLGVQFTNGRGELVTAGGRTVKNVAGYDLTKFMVGQRGVFGRVTSLTVRTYRRPAAALLVRHVADPGVLPRLLATDLRPQWAALRHDALLLGYVGDDTTIDFYERSSGTNSSAKVQRRSIEPDIEHRAELWAIVGDNGTFRASVPPARIIDFVREARLNALPSPDRWTADAAFGIVVGEVPVGGAAETIRLAAERVGGTAAFGGMSGDADLTPAIEVTNDAERRIIERLKAAFDPDGNLSPLPWQRR